MAIAIRSTAIGAFPSRAEAEQAVCGLLGAAFGSDQVGIVLPDAVAPPPGSEAAGTTALWAGAMFRSLKVKNRKLLLVAHETADEVERVKDLLHQTQAKKTTVHAEPAAVGA